MGGGGKGGGTTVQSTQIPPEVLARYNAVNARAESVANQPFQRYGGEFVAPLTPTQQAGVQATSAASQTAQPYYRAATQQLGQAQQGGQNYLGAATDTALVGALPVNPSGLNVGRYMNPYTRSVVGATQAALNQQQGQQLAQQQAEAIRAGAFGGQRAGLQRAQLMGQQGLAQAQAIAPLYQQDYQQALAAAQQQQGVGLGAEQANRQAIQQLGTQLAGLGQQGYAMGSGTAQQLAALGTGVQQAGLTGAQAQIAAGTLQQQTQQAQDTALYQQHLQEQGYPFQVAQFLANIAEGTGALSGNTTTQNKSGGFFSNRGGFKVAERSHRAYGGGLDVNSMGGAVYDPGEYARGGYTDGGATSMGDILAAQQASFLGQGNPYGQGKKPGMGLGIPSEQAKITPLQTKPITQEARGPDPLTAAANLGKNVVGLKNMGQEMKGWFDKKPAPNTTTVPQGEQGLKPTGDKLQQRVADGVMPDANNNVSLAQSGQAHQIDRPAGLAPQGPVYSGPKVEGAPAGGDIPIEQNLSMGPQIKDPGQGLNFDTSDTMANLEDAAGLGGGSDMASLGEGFGDSLGSLGDFASWFGNRGGAVPEYAHGGLVHRQAASTGKFVTPGYDSELNKQLASNPSEMMDTVDESGMQTVGQLKGEQEAMNPKISNSGGGGGGGIGSILGPIASIGSFFFKDGGRAGYAEGGGDRRGDVDPSAGLDIDRLNAILSSGSKAPNVIPISYRTDDGSVLRGQALRSGPFSEYGLGLGTALGGGRLDLDYFRGSAPHSQAQNRAKATWSKPFAYGGLVPRHGYQSAGFVDDQRFDPADVEEAAKFDDRVPTGLDPEVIALSAEKPKSKAQDYFEYLQKEHGLEPHVAAAMLGNAYHESSGLQPRIVGDSGASIGQYQFHSRGEQPAFRKWAEENQRDIYDPYAQHDFVVSQLKGPYSKTLASMREANDPGAAAEAFMRGYERPKAGPTEALQQRMAYANAISRGEDMPSFRPSRSDTSIGLKLPTLGRSGKGEYDNVPAKSASIGDVVREYAPSGMPTSENFWVPALGFLGGMLTSPNRSLAGAIGSGLVSGTSGYMELRKGQQEDVKNMMNFVEKNYKTTLDPDTGNTVVVDKFGQRSSPEDAQVKIAKMFLQQGIDPRLSGIPDSAVKRAREEMKGSVLVAPPVAGGATSNKALPPPAVGEPSKVDQVAAGPQTTTEAEKPKVVPKTKEELLDMGEAELRKYVQSSNEIKEQHGLVGDRDPSVLEAKRKNALNLAEKSKAIGDKDGETFYREQAKTFKEDAEAALKQATTAYLEEGKIHQAGRAKSVQDYRDKMQLRSGNRDDEKSALVELANIMSRTDTGEPQQVINRLREWGNAVGLRTDMSQVADAADAQKIALTRVYDMMNRQNLTRAPAASQKGLAQIVPGPGMPDAATKPLIARALAEMDYARERDEEYRRNHYGKDPLKFEMEYDKAHQDKKGINVDLEKKVAAWMNQLPDPKNVDEKVKLNWYESYGQHGYDPASGVKGGAPATSGNAVNNVPFKVVVP
jgi:hypothetical protein